MWPASYILLGHWVQIYFCTKEAIAEGDKEGPTFSMASFELKMSCHVGCPKASQKYFKC